MNAFLIIASILVIGAVVLISTLVIKKLIEKKSRQIIQDAITEAEIIKKDKILEAKEKFLQLKSEYDQYVSEKNKELLNQEAKFKQKELQLNQKLEEINQKQKELQQQKEALAQQSELLAKKEQELDKLYKQELEYLEKLSGLSVEQAKAKLIEKIQSDIQAEVAIRTREIIEEAKLTANKEAQKIIIEAIQRTAVEHTIENTVSTISIENDEIKGRIIGREGRNIRTFEAVTGVEIIIDDTPEVIIISSFDPYQRELARRSLIKLIADGRIHPARIEEVVSKTKKELEQEILETGKKTLIDLGIHNVHHELVRLIGKMKFRTSYGQNLLQHSIEVAHLCAIMAAELKLNPKLAKRAGLLHDIGKVSDTDTDNPHAIIGMKLAEKYKEPPEVINAIGSHHEEIEMQSLIAPIVQACDAISGARPGARREVVESYISRIKELEAIPFELPGVQKTYAIQAGRELRVIVGADMVSDAEIAKLSYDISKKIEEKLTYPGQIKVTVIRETRAVSYAK